MNYRNNVQRALSCGFHVGYAHLERRPTNCCQTEVHSISEHRYPVTCAPPKTITIDRVFQIDGIDNSLFLVGDIEGYRMNRNYMVELPGEAINITGGNYPTYLLLKDGNLHTLGFSTGSIEAFLRQNKFMFSRDGIMNADLSFFQDYAPQDQSVEGMGNSCGTDREFKFRVISNTTLNDVSTTIEISVWECGEFVDREIWYIVPVRCENCNTLMGANLLPWDYTPSSCGESVNLPGRSTDNGTFVLSNYPSKNCGHGYRGGNGFGYNYNGYGYGGYNGGYYR